MYNIYAVVKGIYYLATFSLFTITYYFKYAGVAELADAPDLGSGIFDVKVQVLSPANQKRPLAVFF